MKIFIKPKNINIYIYIYTALHDVAMVIREENVLSYDNAKMFGQGCLFHNLY